MGILDGLFGSRVSNPALGSAVEKFCSDASDENLVDVWQKFLKAKVALATTQDGARAFARAKNIKEAVGVPFKTVPIANGENLLSVFSDSSACKNLPSSMTTVVVTGEQAFQLASAKGLLGMTLNPGSHPRCELKVWHHQIFIERVSDANKLRALASKLSRSANYADAEGVLKGAIAAAQKEPGAQHPFTAELNLDLARAMRAQGKLNEAEWIYRRAMTIYEASGSHDLELASTCEQLGTLLCENHKASLATPYLEKALEIYERVPGAKPDSIGRILCQMAEAKVEEGKGEEAEAFYKRAAIVLEERKHGDLLVVLNKMGALCEKQGKPKDALAHYMRAINSYEGTKRGREFDYARACHHACSIQIAESQFAEAEALLEKAQPVYCREGSIEDVAALDALKQKIEQTRRAETQAREAEEAKKAKKSPAYARGDKRPSELPLLDMSAMKGNAKATYVPGMQSKKEEEKPSDSDEQALKDMCAFLDSMDDVSASGVHPAPQAVPQPQMPIDDDQAVEKLVKAAIEDSDDHLFALPKVQPQAAAEPAHESSNSAESDDIGVDDLFSSVSTSERMNAYTPTPSKPMPAMQAPEREVPAEPAAPPPPAVPAGSETASLDKLKNMLHQGLFPKGVDQEISGAFNKAVLGSIPQDDRFDKPIAERLNKQKDGTAAVQASASAMVNEPECSSQHAEQASGEAAVAQAPKTPAAPAAPLSVGQKVAADISAVFNKSILGGISRNDRFDKPVNVPSEKPAPAPEVSAPAQAAQTDTAQCDAAQPGLTESLPALSTAKTTEELLALLDKYLEREPENRDFLLRKGTALVQQQRLDEAIKIFDKVTTMCPNDVKAWYCKGSSLHLKSRFEDALYCFNHVLKLEADNVKAMLRKAECLQKLGRGEQSMTLYDRILVLQPQFVGGWLSKARCLLQQRKIQEALQCYAEALKLDPTNEEAKKAKSLIATKFGVTA